MERHPDLPWVKLAVWMMATYVKEHGLTRNLSIPQYTEPWKQHSSRTRVSMPPSIAYIWDRWWKICPYRRHQTEDELVKFVDPKTAEEVLGTKHWYFPDLEDPPVPPATRQGAKVWSSPTWQAAGEGAFGDVTTIGDLWNPVTRTYMGHDARNDEWRRMNSAAKHLVERVIPREWRALLANMTPQQATAWEGSPKPRFQHCVIRSPRQGTPWLPLRRSKYQEVYSQMVIRKTKNIDFRQTLEGPRVALSEMLGKEISHDELWREIRRYERNAKADDLLWRFLHAKVKVGMELDWLLPEKKICPSCRTPEGERVPLTLEHVWIECKAAQQVWDLFNSVWTRLYGWSPRFLPTSRDTLIALFAKCPYSRAADKSRWIILYTAAVWTLWRAYLDSSIDDAEFHPIKVRVRYWEELKKIIIRDKVLAMHPRYQDGRRHSLNGFHAIWGISASLISLKRIPQCLVGLKLPE
jgi:hypothetical protein